jgi:tungstate transport system substrate-binding protein
MKVLAMLLNLLATLGICWGAEAAELRLAVTTSFHNSGLSDVLIPQIKNDIGLNVHLVVVGTGQALRLGRAGDVDAILVHSRKAEEQFVEEGHAPHRREIMYNDFVLIGPTLDPAGVAVAGTIKEALAAIKKSHATFVSRGDDSGTHRKERSLWIALGLDAQTFDPDWYRAVGSGMGATLNSASGMNAYVLADRASWLNFKNEGSLRLLFSGDPVLHNQYAYLPIDARRHPHVEGKASQALEVWLAGPKGQGMIAAYRLGGQQMFYPNAHDR